MAETAAQRAKRLREARRNGGGGQASRPDGDSAAWGSTSRREEEPRVYMGREDGTMLNPFLSNPFTSVGASTVKASAPRIVDESQALAEFYGWVGTPKIREWGEHLVESGLIDEEDKGDYGILEKAWRDAVGAAINMAAGGKKEVDPWKAAAFMGSTGGATSGRRQREKAFSGTKTATDRSVDLTDPADAKALVNDTLTSILGRRANDEEIAAFTSALNNAERAAPVTDTTTARFVEGERVDSTTVRTGGVSQDAARGMMEEQAMAKPEYGAYQASTTYFNALMQAIRAPVQT